MTAPLRNLITDVPGLLVGNASDPDRATGVTAVVFDRPTPAAVAILGGGPGTRDTSLLEPEMTVDGVDALVLSGGSAFGLDAAGGVQAVLAEHGRGFRIRDMTVPIVPQAILFDLLNGGDKHWGRKPPYFDLGAAACEAIAADFQLGTAGAGFGATTSTVKGGLGSASMRTASGFTVGAVVAVNAVGSPLVGSGPHFWAAPFEQNGEFGGLGLPHPWPADALELRIKGAAPNQATTIAIVATDAILGKAECKRVANAAHHGMARALRPSHTPLDGDLVFAAATGRKPLGPMPVAALAEIAMAAADCLARAVARGVYEATSLPFTDAPIAWKDRFANR